MTRRRSRQRHNPLAWLVALVALVAVLNAVAVLERLAGPLLGLAAVGLVVWAVARRSRHSLPPGPPPKVVRGRAGDGRDECIAQLEEENAQLRADLADARDMAHAAWDRASEPGGQDATVVDLRARMLRDPRSGAHPLGSA